MLELEAFDSKKFTLEQPYHSFAELCHKWDSFAELCIHELATEIQASQSC
jgi:hypothetical protein